MGFYRSAYEFTRVSIPGRLQYLQIVFLHIERLNIDSVFNISIFQYVHILISQYFNIPILQYSNISTFPNPFFWTLKSWIFIQYAIFQYFNIPESFFLPIARLNVDSIFNISIFQDAYILRLQYFNIPILQYSNISICPNPFLWMLKIGHSFCMQ